MYQYISDLPPQVREVLTPELQQLWLDSFKAVMVLSGNEVEAYQTAWLKSFQAAFPGEVPADALPQMPQQVSGVGQPAMASLIELDSIKFEDPSTNSSGTEVVGSWIQAMPLGTYMHPIHGKIEFTQERLQRFADNIKAGARGQELDIDYDHKEKSGEAAGWVKDAAVRGKDGLWVFVEWTKDAAQKIKNKAYRYFSPEFVDSWKHPKTQVQFKDVMLGGALTNRPFLKDILPVNLSEVIGHRHSLNEGGVGVNEKLKALAKKLGLGEDATEEQILDAAIAAKAEQTNEQTNSGGDPASGGADTQQTAPAGEGQSVAASEDEDAVKKLMENPFVQKLMERVTTLENSNHEKDVNIKLAELDTSKYIVPPAVKDELKAAMLADPKNADQIFAVAKKLTEGLVEKGERGRTSLSENTNSATNRFEALVKKLQEERKLDYADAVVAASAEDVKLFEEYQQEAFQLGEVN